MAPWWWAKQRVGVVSFFFCVLGCCCVIPFFRDGNKKTTKDGGKTVWSWSFFFQKQMFKIRSKDIGNYILVVNFFLEGSEHRIASHFLWLKWIFCQFEVTEDFLASFCRWKSKDEMYLLLEKVGVLRCRQENPASKVLDTIGHLTSRLLS